MILKFLSILLLINGVISMYIRRDPLSELGIDIHQACSIHSPYLAHTTHNMVVQPAHPPHTVVSVQHQPNQYYTAPSPHLILMDENEQENGNPSQRSMNYNIQSDVSQQGYGNMNMQGNVFQSNR